MHWTCNFHHNEMTWWAILIIWGLVYTGPTDPELLGKNSPESIGARMTIMCVFTLIGAEGQD